MSGSTTGADQATAASAGIGRAQPGVWEPERRLLTVGLVTTVMLVAFEALAVGTVMPLVARDLGGLEIYGWVFSGFFLGSLLGIVAAGAALDRGDARRPLVIGLALFAVGLLAGGFAPSMPVLVAGRIIQGLGAGAIPGIAYVTIGRNYPDASRPTVMAILSTVWVVPGLVGPAIAGWIGDHLSWRIVFLGLLPLILAAGSLTYAALGGRPLRASRRVDGADGSAGSDRSEGGGPGSGLAGSTGGGKVRTASESAGSGLADLARAALVTAGAALLLVASTIGSLLAVPLAMAGLALGLPALAALLPPGTLRGARGLPAGVLARGILTFAFFGAEAYLPLALVAIRGASATEAGLCLTTATVSWSVGSWIQARGYARWGGERLVSLGFAVVIVAIGATASVLAPSVPILVAAATWGIGGLGMGMAYPSLSLLVLRDAPPGNIGAATASLQLTDVLGTSLGTGLGGAVVALAVSEGAVPAVGIGVAFGLSVLVGIAGLAVSFRLKP